MSAGVKVAETSRDPVSGDLGHPPHRQSGTGVRLGSNAKFEERERREAHAQYVESVRERIKLASRIAPRDVEALRGEERALVSGRIIQKLMEIAPDQKSPTVHVTAELIQQIFEVDNLLYFVAPYWWMPRQHWRPGTQPPVPPPVVPPPAPGTHPPPFVPPPGPRTQAPLPATFVPPAGPGIQPALPIGTFVPPPGPNVLTEDNLVGWDGLAPTDPRHGRYFITEDSAPAPMGASLGWLLQLDGDQHRNAFLNSPWVKVVLPIRPCMEMAALRWLMLAHVEGAGPELDVPLAEPEGGTLRQKICGLAQQVCELNDPNNPASLATEAVFENGFDPLEGGFRAPGTTPKLPPDGKQAEPGDPYIIFDQWIEILPTNQVVACEYHCQEHTCCEEKRTQGA